MSTAAKLAGRLSRDTAVFGAGSTVTVALAFAQVAVVTRYLSPAEFGRLAIYFAFAALLTIAYGLGSLQGTLTHVFGSAGEDEIDDREAAPRGNKRRALTTGLALTVVLVSVGTGLISLAAEPIAHVLLGDQGDPSSVRLAAVSGALGALWRLVSNVRRFDGGAAGYAALANVRPVAILVCAIVALTAGGGVEAVLAATSIGTLIALVAGVAVTSRNFELAIGREDVRPILRTGSIYIPLIVSVWIIQNVDLYILSHYVDDADVGVYRVANRVASVVSYLLSAFLMAWLPISRTALFDAARRERGVPGLGKLVVTYYVLLALWLVLALSAGASTLARVAPPAYGEAAELIPLVGAGFLAYGLLVIVYRAAAFPNRRRWYFTMAAVGAVILLASGPPLAAAFGTYGIAAAVLGAFMIAASVLLTLSERGPTPMHLPWGHVAAALACAVLLLLAIAALRSAGVAEGVAGLLGVLSYPVLLVAAGAVPGHHVTQLVSTVRSLGFRRGRHERLVAELAALPPGQRDLLRQAIVGDGRRSAPSEFTDALRRLAGVPARADLDRDIALYLLSDEPAAEREARRQDLRRSGVDPLELHELESALTRLRRLPARSWPGTDR